MNKMSKINQFISIANISKISKIKSISKISDSNFTKYIALCGFTSLSAYFLSSFKSFKTLNSNLQCREKEKLNSLQHNIPEIKCYEELDPSILESKYKNLKLIRSKAFKNLLNMIRDKTVNTSDFRRYSKRLIRILLEEAIAEDFCLDTIKQSPCGYYKSKINPNKYDDYIAVSILRSGDSILDEVTQILPNVMIGKILVQRNEESTEKEAIYFFDKLPTDIENKKVLLVDPMIATGGSAIACIEILLKKGIKQENIKFINIISCEEGIANLLKKYPRLNIVSGVCDPELLTIKYIAPGLGDFGDRYYGTH